MVVQVDQALLFPFLALFGLLIGNYYKKKFQKLLGVLAEMGYQGPSNPESIFLETFEIENMKDAGCNSQKKNPKAKGKARSKLRRPAERKALALVLPLNRWRPKAPNGGWRLCNL